jgi:hypothetical protein
MPRFTPPDGRDMDLKVSRVGAADRMLDQLVGT